MSELFHGGNKIIKILKQAGYEAYFVGGCVRDKLLDRPINDVDIATNAPTEIIMEMFNITIPVGIKHGTVMVKLGDYFYEVSTFKSSGNEKPSILTDLAHRDFTINALALTEDFKLIDPYHFKADIERKVIRAVHNPIERFTEDPLRMLRAIRFVAQLGFQLDEQTKIVITNQHIKFSQVAKERIVQEFEKILLGKFVKNAFSLLIETKLYKQITFIESEKVVQSFCQFPIKQLLTIEERWAAFFYCSKSKTVPPIYMANRQKKEIKTILEGLKQITINGWSLYFIYQTGLTVAKKICRVQFVVNGNSAMTEKKIELLYHQIPIQSRHELSVTGKDIINLLQMHPGPWLRSLLERIEQSVINGEINNNKDEIFSYVVKVMNEKGM